MGKKENEMEAEEEKKAEEEKEKYYEEIIRKFLRILPFPDISSLAEKSTIIGKTIGNLIAKALKEEIRFFLKSVNPVDVMKKVLSDTSIELKIEVTFRDKRKKKNRE